MLKIRRKEVGIKPPRTELWPCFRFPSFTFYFFLCQAALRFLRGGTPRRPKGHAGRGHGLGSKHAVSAGYGAGLWLRTATSDICSSVGYCPWASGFRSPGGSCCRIVSAGSEPLKYF